MLRRLLQRLRPPDVHRPVYERIVAQARQPVFYAHFGAPDTVDGRFDMIVVHLVVALRALRRQGVAAQQLSQGLIDTFFKDMEHSLREMGVSDVAIPKRMKQVVRSFYGRAAAYEPALEAADPGMLAKALRRNVLGAGASAAQAEALARYVLDSQGLMAGCTVEDMRSGRFGWAGLATEQPVPAEM